MDALDTYPHGDPQILNSREELVQMILTAVDTFRVDRDPASIQNGSVTEFAHYLIKPILYEWSRTKKFDQVSELAQQVVDECPLDTLLALHQEFTIYQHSEIDTERNFSRKVADHTLKRFNVDPKIINQWIKPDIDKNEYERSCLAINRNVPNVIQLEQKHPGSASFLIDHFQFTDFQNRDDLEDYVLPWYEQIVSHKDFGDKDPKDIWGELIVDTLKTDRFSEEDAVELMDVWHACARKGSFFMNVAKNLEAIAMTEAEANGESVTKTLFDQFGICNFLRYNQLQLVEQYLHRNDMGDFGLVVYPKADWNGAFESNRAMLANLYKQAKGLGIQTRIFEADSVSEMIFRVGSHIHELEGMKRDSDTNQTTNKIAFMMLAGHGEEKSVQLGRIPAHREENHKVVELGNPKQSVFKRPKRHQLILKDDLRHGTVFRRWFVENPSIVLISCSTGMPSGIGEKLSEILDATVRAPDNPTNIKSIKVKKFGDSSPILDPEYYSGVNTNVFRLGRLRHQHRN